MNRWKLLLAAGLCIGSAAAQEIQLADALKHLERVSGQTIIFTYEDVQAYQVDSVIPSPDIRKTLSLWLKGLPLTYRVKKDFVIISRDRRQPQEEPLPTHAVKQQRGITGQILNAEQQPIEAAFICLVDDRTNQPLAQAISDAQGNYFLNCCDHPVKISVTCLGYKAYISQTIDARSPQRIATIHMEDESQMLDNIVVVGEKSRPIIEQKAGKLIFNVENSINAQGSNAYDILKQLPGIVCHEESKTISLNGQSSILIMLNGKPTYMQQSEVVDLLRSTSSANIKSIEVMSNATAQYDATGSGGILNIVLKRGKEEGYNMMVNLGASYWENPKQNAELAFNYTKNRWNLYANYSHQFGHSGIYYGSERKQSGKLFDSRSTDTDKRNTAAATIGLDYQLAENHTIGVQGNGNFVFGPGEILTDNDVYDSYEKTKRLYYSIYSETQYEHQLAARYNFNLNYRYEVPDERSLTFDVDYGLFKGNSRIYQPNTYYSPAGLQDSTQNFRSRGDRDIHLYALSLNYKQAWWNGNWMGGMKFSNVQSSNGYKYYRAWETTDVIDPNVSNDFNYLESILAGYLLYDFSFLQKWQANVGVRVEYTHSNGHLMPLPGSTQQESHVKRDYVDVFPSVGITFRPDEKQSISLSYGKRIDRPIYSDLNPIEQALDGLSVWKGNPFLIPQKTNRIRLQYQYDKTSVGISYSVTDDYQVQVTDTLGLDKIVMEPRNLGKQSYFGVSLTQGFHFFHAWDLTLSGNLYHLDNRMTFDAQRYYHRKNWAANFSLQSSFPLVWGIRAELLGVFLTKRPGGSTEMMDRNGFVDIGLQKKFLDGKAAVKLSLSDVFWSNHWGDGVNRMTNLESRSYGYGESRLLRINFTYSFGGNKQHEAKRSNVDAELNRF